MCICCVHIFFFIIGMSSRGQKSLSKSSSNVQKNNHKRQRPLTLSYIHCKELSPQNATQSDSEEYTLRAQLLFASNQNKALRCKLAAKSHKLSEEKKKSEDLIGSLKATLPTCGICLSSVKLPIAVSLLLCVYYVFFFFL